MLGHTDNDKDRLQIRNHKSDLHLRNFGEVQLGNNKKIDSIMEKIPKISGALRSNCCETCRNIPQKTPMKKFSKKNSLTRQRLFRTVCSNF